MDKFTYKLLKKEKNKFEYDVKVSKEAFDQIYNEIFDVEAQKVKLPGFRPGKAPRAEVETRIAPDVLNKTINRLLPNVTYEIILKEELNPISNVSYDLKKINEDSTIEYSFTIYDSPEVKASDLSKMKVEYKEEKVKDEEIDMVIRNIIQQTLPEEVWNKGVKKGKKSVKKDTEEKEEPVQFEITDEMVAQLGYEDEKTLDGLKSKVRETLEKVKKEQTENEYANKVLKEAIKYVDFLIPEDLIEHEVEHREHHFIERLKKLKLDIDAYLKTQNKTLEDLRKNWKADIENAIGADIITINLAKSEKLVPTEEEIEEEIEKFEDEIAKVRYRSDERLRDQLRTAITRDRGLRKLMDIAKGK